jgi:hypothetical protein
LRYYEHESVNKLRVFRFNIENSIVFLNGLTYSAINRMVRFLSYVAPYTEKE